MIRIVAVFVRMLLKAATVSFYSNVSMHFILTALKYMY